MLYLPCLHCITITCKCSIFLPVQTNSACPGTFDLECILPVLNTLLDKCLQTSEHINMESLEFIKTQWMHNVEALEIVVAYFSWILRVLLDHKLTSPTNYKTCIVLFITHTCTGESTSYIPMHKPLKNYNHRNCLSHIQFQYPGMNT